MRHHILLGAALVMGGCGDGAGDDSAEDTSVGGTTDACPVTLTTEALPGALYSVFGTSSSDVYVVGADAGAGPEIHHWDGAAWAAIDCGHSGDLWWGWHSGGDEVVFVGAEGAVYSYVPSTGACTDQSIAVNKGTVFFGAWGSSSDDVYAVGGNPSTGSGGVIFHRVGGTWSQVTGLPPEVGPGQVFKVWGDGPDNVWMVGANALLLHWDGAVWTVHPAPVSSTTTFFTVNGHGSDVYAVGGFGSGVVARYDGTTWTDDSPPPEARASGINGVYASAQGVMAVGNSGTFVTRADTWTPPCDIPITFQDYHGSFIDPDGGLWAVGGTLSQQTDGIVAYMGPNPPTAIAR